MDDAAIYFDFSIKLMTRAFRDLASSFATVDAASADRTIHEIETAIARELLAFREKQAERIGAGPVDAILRAAAEPLREMTQQARGLIQQAGKPKN